MVMYSQEQVYDGEPTAERFIEKCVPDMLRDLEAAQQFLFIGSKVDGTGFAGGFNNGVDPRVIIHLVADVLLSMLCKPNQGLCAPLLAAAQIHAVFSEEIQRVCLSKLVLEMKEDHP